MNINQEILSWEQCREEIIELGKFEFRDNMWISHYRGVTRIFRKRLQLKFSCIFHIENLPEDISDQEIIYHILCNYHIFIDAHCKECGKKLKFKCYCVGYKVYCSSNCSNKSKEKIETFKNNYFNKTGYYNPFQNPEIIDKIKKIYFNKTGYSNPQQNPEVREKQKKTYFEKTGYDHQFKNPEVIRKIENTNLKNMGFKHCLENPIYVEKSKQTRRLKTGYDHALQNPECMLKRNKTQKDRTGYEFSGQNPELLSSKLKKTSTFRWGMNLALNLFKLVVLYFFVKYFFLDFCNIFC